MQRELILVSCKEVNLSPDPCFVIIFVTWPLFVSVDQNTYSRTKSLVIWARLSGPARFAEISTLLSNAVKMHLAVI